MPREYRVIPPNGDVTVYRGFDCSLDLADFVMLHHGGGGFYCEASDLGTAILEVARYNFEQFGVKVPIPVIPLEDPWK